MDTRSKYQRIFLIFNSEDIGYGVGQEPSGYVKIEVNEGNGKLLASIQSLNESRGIKFKLYMIKSTDDSFVRVCMGEIPLSRGKGELKLELDPLNVLDSGVPVHDFNIAAVIGDDNKTGSSNLICPLIAYKDGNVAWRDKFKKAVSENQKTIRQEKALSDLHKNSNYIQDSDTISMNKFEVKGEEKGSEQINIKPAGTKKVQDIIKKPEEIQEADHIPPESPSVPEIPEEAIVPEIHEIPEAPDTVKSSDNDAMMNNPDNKVKSDSAKKDMESEKVQEKGKKQDDYDEYRQMLKDLASKEKENNLNNYIGCMSLNQGFCSPLQNAGESSPCLNCKIYNDSRKNKQSEVKQVKNTDKLRAAMDKFFESYDPFRSRRRDYRWWKVGSPVQLNNVLYQCDIKTPLLFNPALMMAHFKYRHIIAGIYTDSYRRREYIVCGIPGVYNVDEKPFGNMCRWVQVEGSKPRYGAFGYWLVYIDGKTGKFLSLN